MKKLLILLTLLLLPAFSLAEELNVTWKAGGSRVIDSALLTDGSDETVYRFAIWCSYKFNTSLIKKEVSFFIPMYTTSSIVLISISSGSV